MNFEFNLVSMPFSLVNLDSVQPKLPYNFIY